MNSQTIDGVLRELKPCPFCGGSADLKCTEGDYPDWFVQCTECHASVDVFGPGAVHHWNDRKLPAAQSQGVPVAWQLTMNGAQKEISGKIGPSPSWENLKRHGYKVEPLYAEQPAPVAVALPVQRNSADGRHDERVEGYNEALADVRRAISFSAKHQ